MKDVKSDKYDTIYGNISAPKDLAKSYIYLVEHNIDKASTENLKDMITHLHKVSYEMAQLYDFLSKGKTEANMNKKYYNMVISQANGCYMIAAILERLAMMDPIKRIVCLSSKASLETSITNAYRSIKVFNKDGIPVTTVGELQKNEYSDISKSKNSDL